MDCITYCILPSAFARNNVQYCERPGVLTAKKFVIFLLTKIKFIAVQRKKKLARNVKITKRKIREKSISTVLHGGRQEENCWINRTRTSRSSTQIKKNVEKIVTDRKMQYSGIQCSVEIGILCYG